MSILEKIKSIEYDRNQNHVFGIKSGILWGHAKDRNGSFPLLYISKPRSISQEDFEEILNKLDINILK